MNERAKMVIAKWQVEKLEASAAAEGLTLQELFDQAARGYGFVGADIVVIDDLL